MKRLRVKCLEQDFVCGRVCFLLTACEAYGDGVALVEDGEARATGGRYGAFTFFLCIYMALNAGGCSASQAEVTLSGTESEPPAVYVMEEPCETEQYAAEELARVLGVMTDAGVDVIEVDGAENVPSPEEGAVFVVGELAEDLGLSMDKSSPAGDGYRYVVREGRVLVVGESPAGVRHGVFAFLEHLGAGWYTPGEIGEVIPQRESVGVAADLDHSEVSDSVHRRFWYHARGSSGESREAKREWTRRLGGDNRIGSWSHAWRGLVRPDDHFEDNPELFSYNRELGERTTRQLCTTNPETIRIAAEALMQSMEANPDAIVFNAGPNDGGGLCECDDCIAIDDPGYLEPSSGRLDATDRIFKFAEELAGITSEKYPDRQLGVLIYSDYSRIPRKIEKLHPNVRPQFAPIRRCRLHGPGHPECHWNQLWSEEIHGWAEITDKLGFYIYNQNLAEMVVPLSKIGFYRRLQKHAGELEVDELDWVFETNDSWAQLAPHLYLSVRLSWRSDIDIEETMDRFFDGFYGAAAGPMRSYWMRVDEAYERGDTHTGSVFGLHHVWTDELLSASREDIESALELAADERERAAVEMAEAALRCAELFAETRSAINKLEFGGANETFQELLDHLEYMEGVQHAPNWHQQRPWIGRFLGRIVEGGYEALRGGGRPLVQMPDVWKFTRDEAEVGVDKGYWRTEFDDSGWKDIHTYTKSWDDQGLGWYHGQAWYRVEFEMPEFDADADIRLWFGGFDENVDVYLNGEHLGEERGFATPAEYEDIAGHLASGGENVLAVRVTNYDLAEIGTGGIMMPVMVYESAETADPDDEIEEDEVRYKM